jgi:hypothetical protein
MKPCLALLLILFVLFSCSSPDVKPAAAVAVKDSTSLPFAGVWVNAAYVNQIRKTRSPRLSQEAGGGESLIIIPERTKELVMIVYNFHEGSGGLSVVNDGSRYKLHSTDTSQPEREVKLVSTDSLRLGDRFFLRLHHPDSTLDDRGVLEELLFAGKYRDEAGKTVTFGYDGRVTGLDTFTYYAPACDYIGDPNDFEKLFLGRVPEMYKMNQFGYQLEGDSLKIYGLECTVYDTVAKECAGPENLGRLLRTLVRLQ